MDTSSKDAVSSASSSALISDMINLPASSQLTSNVDKDHEVLTATCTVLSPGHSNIVTEQISSPIKMDARSATTSPSPAIKQPRSASSTVSFPSSGRSSTATISCLISSELEDTVAPENANDSMTKRPNDLLDLESELEPQVLFLSFISDDKCLRQCDISDCLCVGSDSGPVDETALLMVPGLMDMVDPAVEEVSRYMNSEPADSEEHAALTDETINMPDSLLTLWDVAWGMTSPSLPCRHNKKGVMAQVKGFLWGILGTCL